MIDKSKYIVLDVETNGLSSQKDDLLSISLYSPDREEFYDRFLPLDLQNDVLTTFINGITKKMLMNKEHLTQQEFDDLINRFELNKRIILTYGKLDKTFIKAYLKRHKIKGFESLNFHNIKDDIISSSYTNGLLTKDNICNALKIDGVTSVHSGHNDCLLEWKLFEKMDGKKWFVAYTFEFCPSNIKHKRENWYIYEYSDEYIIPVSYLHSHPKIIKVLSLPNIEMNSEVVFRYTFSDKCSPEYARQPAGIASEHLIKRMLNAKVLDNREYLIANKQKLKYLGCIEAEDVETILYAENDDGTIRAIRPEDKLFVEAINKQTEAIRQEINPVIEYIKNDIFKNEEIFAQELIVNKQLGILGLCDFSNSNACLEAKWHFAYSFNKKYIDEFKYQLYITSNSRPCYIIVGSENSIEISKITFKIE